MNFVSACLGLAGFLICTGAANAAGTAAGAVISNTATVNYLLNSGPQPPISASAAFAVLEVIDVSLTWHDSFPISTASPASNRPLTFHLTNTGNGSEAFSLSRNNALPGDNFDPGDGAAGAFFLESGLAPGFQASGANADTPYNEPPLAPDQTVTVYVVSDIPASQPDNTNGLVRLTASSKTPGAAGAPAGASFPGQGAGGAEAIVGASQGLAQRDGSYVISGLTVDVAKTVVTVVDPRGGNSFEPGSTVTYRIVVTVSGSGTAANLAVNDPLPTELTYVAGSTTVGGATRTDALDADNAYFTAGALNVNFGSVAGPTTLPAIEFRAVLN
jgi:uncharacterized repeat protein (TIGR01451 family)